MPSRLRIFDDLENKNMDGADDSSPERRGVIKLIP